MIRQKRTDSSSGACDDAIAGGLSLRLNYPLAIRQAASMPLLSRLHTASDAARRRAILHGTLRAFTKFIDNISYTYVCVFCEFIVLQLRSDS